MADLHSEPIEMPAVCEDCGLAFGSGWAFSRATKVTLTGNRAGPCPRCGGLGVLPDGVYDFTDAAIKVLSAPSHSRKDLEDLGRLLGQIDLSALDPPEVADLIAEKAPRFAGLAETLRPRNAADVAAYLAVLVALISVILRG